MYNEYIVYKVEQIKLKYLLRIKFDYGRRWNDQYTILKYVYIQLKTICVKINTINSSRGYIILYNHYSNYLFVDLKERKILINNSIGVSINIL